MPTYPLASLAPTIDEFGISAPPYSDILLSLQASYRLIYGASSYLDADSQDGQWIAILAKAIDDSNQAAIAVFRSFSPTYSQGTNLSSLVRINGILRKSPTFSIAQGDVVGQIGTVITNGVVQDTNNNLWNLPPNVVIPTTGVISVTVTAQSIGDVAAVAGSINQIATPQKGWQSFISTSDASNGSPIETDSQLRNRQTLSTALPSKTVLEGTIGAVTNVAGVGQVRGYENDTGAVDANGIPNNSISIVAETGDSFLIATAIAIHKTPGTRTYGSTSVTVYDQYGAPNAIKFFRPTIVTIGIELTVHALQGWTSGYVALIKQALVDYVNAIRIGDNVYINRLFGPANLYNDPTVGQTFEIDLLRIKKNSGSFGNADILIAFNELSKTSVNDILVTIV